MFNSKIDGPRPTLIAGLILVIVLAAVAAMSAGSCAAAESSVARQVSSSRTHITPSQRLVPRVHDLAVRQMLGSLGPIDQPIAACFGDEALVAYDLGIAPATAFEVLDRLLESSAPEVHDDHRLTRITSQQSF